MSQNEKEARVDASQNAAGNLLLAARLNERQARRLTDAQDDVSLACRIDCRRLARHQRALLAGRRVK